MVIAGRFAAALSNAGNKINFSTLLTYRRYKLLRSAQALDQLN